MNGYIPVSQDANTQTDLSSSNLGSPLNVTYHCEKDGGEADVAMETEKQGERESLNSNQSNHADDDEVEAGVDGGGGGDDDGGGGGQDEENFDVILSRECCCCSCPKWNFTLRQFLQETKILLKLAWPNVLYMLLEAMMTIMAVLFSGHLGKNELAAASFANSITTVFTRSVGLGFASSCDTLFSQFYGSPNKGHIGLVLQRGLLIMGLLCFLCWGILLNAETILLLARQNSEVARLAGIYCLIYIPAVPADYYSMLLIKYLQCQSRLTPVVVTTALTNAVSVAIYYVLIYPLDLRLAGAAVAQVLSHFILCALITGYIFWKQVYKETWTGWSKGCVDDWMPICKLGLAGCLMVCLEWWSFDVGFYLAGLLSEEQVGAHAIIMYTATTGYMFPYGIGTAAAIRVGNSLGGRRPSTAQVASVSALVLGAIAATIMAILYASLKDVIPYLFTSDSATAKVAASILPICATFAVLDATATVCGGVLRGTGRQAVGAVVDLLGYYLIGLPIAISLMFPLGKQIFGFWSGMTIGLLIQAGFLVVFTLRLDWHEETRKAQKRVGLMTSDSDIKSSLDSNSCDSEDCDVPSMDGPRRRSLLPPNLSRALSDDNSNLQRTSSRVDEIQEGMIVDKDQVDCAGRRMSNSNFLAQKAVKVLEKLSVANGHKPHQQISKEAEAEKYAASQRSMFERTRWQQLFLFLSLIYLILAIVCYHFAIPPLRRSALEREAAARTNFTSGSTMIMATNGIAYQYFQTTLIT